MKFLQSSSQEPFPSISFSSQLLSFCFDALVHTLGKKTNPVGCIKKWREVRNKHKSCNLQLEEDLLKCKRKQWLGLESKTLLRKERRMLRSLGLGLVNDVSVFGRFCETVWTMYFEKASIL
ncbi:hypothetical protein F2P56_001386 [Juglans regia]|uniref:Uncharacterized protein LOC109021131 isoform X2 n=2 Tax=Juglans regia TaxID=51240 RepID=A0A2I4HSW0_JUGRE|nr:uncharacterized protein LOC109021131 isoform X2 [Juglans regia]KAF5480651.1 hypothetical protein F2P56_001386 [Juglans regia]